MATPYQPTVHEIRGAECAGHRAGLDGNYRNPYEPATELYDAWETGYRRGAQEMAEIRNRYNMGNENWMRVR